MGKLTISEVERISLELGFTPAIHEEDEDEPTIESRIIFRKDAQKARDREIYEQVIQEIMENRKVSREEALKILNNPF